MTATGAVMLAPELTLLDKLHAHLLTHLDADYAAFVLAEIEEFCRENRPREKGVAIPSMWDDEIARLNAAIEDNHTGGKKLVDYWGIFYRSVHLIELRNNQRYSGAPVKELQRLLIQLLDDLYPPGIGRKSLGKDFEYTVQLAWLLAGLRPLRGETFKLNTVHDAVVDAIDGTGEYPTVAQIAAEIAFRERVTFEEAFMEYRIQLSIAY